jgi:hypothetical protein
VALLAFFAAQFCDGMFTYLGVQHFGPGIEANPIVASYIAALGPGSAVIAVKGFAVVCAALLHLCARHFEVAALTIRYGVAAVWPWMSVLVAASGHPR